MGENRLDEGGLGDQTEQDKQKKSQVCSEGKGGREEGMRERRIISMLSVNLQ